MLKKVLLNSACASKRSICATTYTARKHNWQSETLMDIGTGKNYNEDHDLFREQCRKFWKNIDPQRVQQWDRQHMADKEIWREAGAAGMLCLDTPAEYGGIGADFSFCAVSAEEQGYAGPDFFGPGFGLHTSIVAPYLFNYGTEEQKHKYLPSMTQGETISCIGMTEPSGGSDLAALKTTAKADGDDYILSGSKTFISNGTLANLGLIAARTKFDGKPAHGISLFLVDEREHKGFVKGKNLRKVGQHTYDTAELFFEDIRLPKSALLGGEEGLHKGFYFMMQELPRERAGGCLEALAHLEYAFEATRAYTKERMTFGTPLSQKQAIRHKMANIKTDIVTCRMMTDECMRLFQNDELDYDTVSMAKMYVTEKFVEHTSNLLQLWGGWGYMWEYPIAKSFAGARVTAIYAGSSEIMRELIARGIYGR